MVDLQGKFYLIEDLDANFVNACVNKEAYAHHAGGYVKNAYDPQFNVDGVWDKKASDKAEDLNIVLCYELKQEGKAFKSENTCTTILTVGVPTSLSSIIHWIAGLSRIQPARSAW